MSFRIIYITHPDEATAVKVSNALLDAKLVACSNIFPISSAYFWNDALHREGEYVTIVKSTRNHLKAITKMVESIHPYDVPCILHFKAKANPSYEAWIKESVSNV